VVQEFSCVDCVSSSASNLAGPVLKFARFHEAGKAYLTEVVAKSGHRLASLLDGGDQSGGDGSGAGASDTGEVVSGLVQE
jgi:hypothetical protein